MPWEQLACLIVMLMGTEVHASEDEERLMSDVFRGYNSLIPPFRNMSDMPIVVRVALQIVLLIDVKEKDQVMHTNVWLTLKWHDFQMRWNPVKYGEIKEMRVSPDKVWLPDIVLFNKHGEECENIAFVPCKSREYQIQNPNPAAAKMSADGNYEVSFMCNVVINYLGDMLWVPPAIYKSSCIIDVEYFPFDEQVCTLVFGSWTYSEKEIILEFDQAEWADVGEYAPSSIWDLMDAPASLVNKRSRIEFQVRIRRKTLFYTVILIIPSVLMTFISMAVFFLPTDSGEKVTLTTLLLLSIVVFLLLVSKILPPTSSTIPLMAKYLLLTFVLNVITIVVTGIIINVYFRSPTTHSMPSWVRELFLKKISFMMCMTRPKSKMRRLTTPRKTVSAQLPGVGHFSFRPSKHHPFCPSADDRTVSANVLSSASGIVRDPATAKFYPLSPDALLAIDAIEYITEHLKQEEENKMLREEWKYIAMIIDRLLLYVFFGITLGGTCGILFSAPHVFQGVNQREVLRKLTDLYSARGNS